MSVKSKLKEAFDVEAEYDAVFTGGHVRWTSDGQRFLCQNNARISVVSVSDNKVERTIGDDASGSSIEQTADDIIYTFALSNDDEFLCTVHKSSLLKLWHMVNGQLVRMWKSNHQGPVPTLAFSPNSIIVASGGTDSTVRLWDYQRRTCLGSLRGTHGVINVLEFNPQANKRLVYATGDDNTIRGWHWETRDLIVTLTGHLSKVTSLSFTDDGRHLVSSSRDKVLILWDLEQQTQVRVVPTYECIESVIVLSNKTKLPASCELADDKVYAASAGEDGIVKVWEMNTARLVYEQKNSLISKAGENDGLAITQMLFNCSTSQFSVVSADHNIMIHNSSNFFCAKQFIGFSSEILDMTFLGKKNRYLAVATNSADIKIYDTLDMNCKVVKGHTDIVLSLASLRNFLLSSSKDNTIRLWEIDPSDSTVTCIGIGNKHTKAVGCVAFGKISHTSFASVSQDTCLKMWNVPKTIEKGSVLSLNCVNTQIAHKDDINCVTISPNDKLIATASQDKTAKLWTANNLTLLGVLRGHRRGIWCARFSPIDQILMTTSGDCSIKLWSLTDMACVVSLEGHDSSVMRAEFIGHGMQILSAGSDGLIKVWNIKSSDCVTTLDRHDGRIWTMAVAHDESFFYSGGADSMLLKWKDVTDEQKQAKQKELQEAAIEEQELSNLLKEKKMLKALRLALRLGKPHLSMKIITQVIKNHSQGLEATIARLANDDKETLLNHVTVWNTNSRNCRVAQLVMSILVKEVISGKFIPCYLNKLVEESLPYTDRHFKRMTDYLIDLKFVEHTLTCMQPYATIDVEMTDVAELE